MRTLTIAITLPTPEASDAIADALRAALPAHYVGVGSRTHKTDPTQNVIWVHLNDGATADDENTARQIVLTHDFSKRTPEQIARVEKKQVRDAARTKAHDSKATKDDQIEYLMLEVANLRERSGEI